jgi:glycosyltransferase involved in cell wall biosynthesis
MKIQNDKIKIALIGDSLSGGGAEKVHALLSRYFDKEGFDVTNCIFEDKINYQYAGSLFNLDLHNSISNKYLRRAIVSYKFNSFIKSSNFDLIVDFRMRTNFLVEFLHSRFIYPKRTIYTVHSGFLNYYFPKSKLFSSFLYKKHHLVSVSKAIEKKLIDDFSFNDVTTIYNPIDLVAIQSLKNQFKINGDYILIIGNMNSLVKQIDKIIVAYSNTFLPKQKIKLKILGDGCFRKQYENLVEQLYLTDVIQFEGFVNNPFPYLMQAKYLILASKNEGFPNAILESLACQTPVISFDCFSGPNEILVNNFNGILVENQNFEQLKVAMEVLIADKVLYKHCVENTMDSVKRFDIKNIGNQWQNYFSAILKEKS